jgi:branched-subunit amino acid aminotransferase/4-amino-4-deoxychorismate lyase
VTALCWVDGALRSSRDACVRAGDSTKREGRGCYTTARVTCGAVRFEDEHVARLLRDAALLGFAAPDPELLRRGLVELARAAFPASEGIVRLQISCNAADAPHMVATARPLGDDAPCWRAITAPLPHDGSPLPGGPKLTQRAIFARAAAAARAAGAHEALLFDRDGRLVEGARSNLIVARDNGAWMTPPLLRGPVAGIARARALARVEGLREGDLDADALHTASEVVAVNAVRGARALVMLDARPLGSASGPLLEALARALA